MDPQIRPDVASSLLSSAHVSAHVVSNKQPAEASQPLEDSVVSAEDGESAPTPRQLKAALQQPSTQPTTAPSGRLSWASNRHLNNFLKEFESPHELKQQNAYESGVVVTVMETVLNKAHRNDDTRKREAAKFALLILKAHGNYVYDHCTRLVDLALALARELGCEDPQLQRAVEDGMLFRDIGEVGFFLTKQSPRQRYALSAYLAGVDIAQESLLHDVGKIQVPPEILYKPGPLTAAEQEIMQMHPVWGAELLSRIPPLSHAIPVTRHHHERWDGAGYPDKLAGEDIPLAARLVSVVDAFDAMVSDRPYREALPFTQARDIIAKASGTQFEPRIVDGFLRIVESVWSLETQY